MEIGPEAVPESRIGAMPYEKTQIGSIVTSLRKGDVFDVLHEYPDIIEWSKPLPREQWETPSPELLTALAQQAATS
ncbi:hypothetical protein A221_20580 [Pseudomonas syringae pv. actinidiae ICMP 18801]|nr:hypothetical protein A221_20580 [Pseudomonas syringae pv. actinidiae ICMP 18801]